MVRLMLFGLSVLVSGCLGLNDVRPIRMQDLPAAPSGDRTFAVVSLSVDAPQLERYPFVFSVSIDEYSIEHQDISGNCFRYNHMYPGIDPIAGNRQYFAFDVRPGYYTVSGIGGREKTIAFELPVGGIVYLGDIALTDMHGKRLSRDASLAPKINDNEIRLASTRDVRLPHAVVCGGF